MKRFICILLAIVSLASFCACDKNSDSLSKDYSRNKEIPVYDFLSGEAQVPEDYEEYTKGTTEFSFDLLSAVAHTDDNVVVSPLSVATALSMLANGASSATRKELRNVLAQGADLEAINSGNYYLNCRLTAFNNDKSKFTSANSLWLNDSFAVKPAFLQTAVNYYDADIQRVLFSEEKSVDKINKWVADKTDKEITAVLEKLSDSEMAVLINAVLFDDEWATPYEESQLKDGTFHGTKGDTTAKFMNSTELYLETSYAKGITKGFANLPLKFAAILPAEDVDMKTFAEGFSEVRWQGVLGSQQITQTCKAAIPEFEIRSTFDFTDYLKALGIRQAFESAKADFTNLTNTDDFYVSEVAQQAVVKINSKGVKAAAATTIKGNGAAAPSEEEKELNFDRPFMFVIYDNESGTPVFAGIVNNIE